MIKKICHFIPVIVLFVLLLAIAHFGDNPTMNTGSAMDSLVIVETDCQDNVYNCEDFINHFEAQEAFEFCGGLGYDVHWLDGDQDGIACEELLELDE